MSQFSRLFGKTSKINPREMHQIFANRENKSTLNSIFFFLILVFAFKKKRRFFQSVLVAVASLQPLFTVLELMMMTKQMLMDLFYLCSFCANLLVQFSLTKAILVTVFIHGLNMQLFCFIFISFNNVFFKKYVFLQ